MNLRHLFNSLSIADIARQNPLTYFDIGSRGGFQSDLHPLAFAVDVVGFEPDPEEFRRLQKLSPDPWRTVKYLPQAVGGNTGQETLYIPTDPQSASLLKHDAKIGEKFNKPQFFEIDRTAEIQTLGLEDALAKTEFNSIDYLKIDIEGAELAVFQSSPQIMNDVLAVKTEISFIPFRHDQPLAGDVDANLRQSGFELMDIIGPAHWRRQGYLIHPYYAAETPPYSRAQIVQADYLFFRDPDSLKDNIGKLLKLALISLSLGYFDHALMILERPELTGFLTSEYKLSPLEIVTPASRRYGRKMFGRAVYRQLRDLVPFIRYSKNIWR